MDKNAIKKYAVWARRELIDRVSQRAMIYGITAKDAGDPKAESVNGHLLSQTEKRQRQALIRNIKGKGYEQVMEEVAYTWFNRFAALRFMEVNGYLPSHIRVFTNEAGEFKPQILTEAIHLKLDGLDMNKVYELENANKTEELYKYLLIVQCNALNSILPGLFQRIEDYTELLLPDYLLREGSVVEQMVTMIPEEDWTDQVQIIGWLYEGYNSELNATVYDGNMSKLKITKDLLPAATTIYTPDWPVHYLVENSLGRLWLEGHPNDALKSEWKYYLDEAEQEPEVQAQLTAIRKEYAALKPEEIRVIDPCMGSGHILCVLFDVLVRIYEDYGYTAREAAVKIVENNLWGLDIDDRAAQLAYFSVMMKARQYDRFFFRHSVQPNVYAIEESNWIGGAFPFDMRDFLLSNEHRKTLNYLIYAFQDAKEYGSILQLENRDYANFIKAWELTASQTAETLGLLLWYDAVKDAIPALAKLAIALTQRYDVVVTNPPYLGSSRFSPKLDKYVKEFYPNEKSDLSMAMYKRAYQGFCKPGGMTAFITTSSWMFLSSFEKVRDYLNQSASIVNLVDYGTELFDGKVGHNPIVAWVTRTCKLEYNMTAIRLVDYCYSRRDEKEHEFFEERNRYTAKQSNFSQIPGLPVAYWVSEKFIQTFTNGIELAQIAPTRKGMFTGNNEFWLKLWFEIEAKKLNCKFKPYNKGGEFRKWYGNQDYVINWEEDGRKVQNYVGSGNINKSLYFKPCITWSLITSYKPSFRIINDVNHVMGDAGPISLAKQEDIRYLLGLLNSKYIEKVSSLIAPTLNFSNGVAGSLPVIFSNRYKTKIDDLVEACITISKSDWDSFETSWDFKKHPLLPLPIEDNHIYFCLKIGEEKWIRALKDGQICFNIVDSYIKKAEKDGNNEQGDLNEGVFARLHKTNSKVAEMKSELGSDLEIIPDGDYVKLRRYSTRNIPLFCIYGIFKEDLKQISDAIKNDDGTYTIKTRIDISSKMYKDFLNKENIWGFYVSSGHFFESVEAVLLEKKYAFKRDRINYTEKSKNEFFIEPTDSRNELFYKDPHFSYQNEERIVLYDLQCNDKLILNYGTVGDRSGNIAHGEVFFEATGKGEKKADVLISDCYNIWAKGCNERFAQLKANEEELNRIFIDIYGLQDELTPEVEDRDVTVRRADLGRDIRSLISYAVGCMFGRYSLDKPGLVYAGGKWSQVYRKDRLVDESGRPITLGGIALAVGDEYTYVWDTNHWVELSFSPDKDNIIPICDDDYFEDDITGKFIKWVEVVYGKDTLEENLKFIANALGGKGISREVIRNYFMNDFYADHLKVYQKRPIYWLFDSGKKNGFKCLIYMHRYQPDTIARIRTDYVHEQQSRYRTAIADLEQRINGASTSERVKLNKHLQKLQAQAEEIRVYEEKIHHLADQMIRIDLDDGVKHNYEIFKDVLAKIK